MNRQTAEKHIAEYLKPIFGFALKRCKTTEDAEDLSQEIVLRAFRALLTKDDIDDVTKYIWTIAHNTLNNYYRGGYQNMIGVSVDEVAELIADPDADVDADDQEETIRRLQCEIAYLSKLQRKIVIAYYFENQKQTDIAQRLGIPVGTVKWHLFEAKKELKRGIDKMRKASELKFNPIRFHNYSINGCIGKKTLDEFFRSTLAQNICYGVRDTAKTINEIADDLGVSPVYVETEVNFLEEYGFLRMQGDKYLVNFIIDEPTKEQLALQNDMYRRAAELFANDLYDELISSGLLDDPAIICNQTDAPLTMTASPRGAHNFLLWSLIPYIAANSGEHLMDRRISFDEVATLRPDGAHNIACAAVVSDEMILPEDYIYMKNWCGPMWNGIDNGSVLWQIDSPWSDRPGERVNQQYSEHARRTLSLYQREEENGLLSKDEYTWLAEHGYVKLCGDYDGLFKASWQLVILSDREIRKKLLNIGNRIKEKHKEVFDALKKPYFEAMLASVPVHLRKIRAYELQAVFYHDGWFLLHCVLCLLRNGKLKEPTEGQRKILTTLIVMGEV